MKITAIELYHVSVPLKETFWPTWIPGYPQTHNRFTLIKIVTDEGIEGYSAGSAMGKESAGLGDLLGGYLMGAGKGDSALFDRLNTHSRNMDWGRAHETEFVGNLRINKSIAKETSRRETRIYLLRKLNGGLYILSLPADSSARAKDANSPYAGLDEISGIKMVFNVKTMRTMVEGEAYAFAKLTTGPGPFSLRPGCATVRWP
jgi:hypothetical protein